MPSVEGMSVKEMKEELATLGSSAEGCCERSEIEEKLRQVRQAKGGHGPAAAAGAPAPAVAGMEQFMASMTASFNTMGDSFGNMMKKVSDKFDALDTKLDDLESKRGQLRQTLEKEPTTALGRLNQLKAASAASTFDQELEAAKAQKKAEKQKINQQLAEQAAGGGR